MGVSTDAYLAFGIDLGEDWEDKVPWNREDGMDYWIYEQSGDAYTYDFQTATEEEKRHVWDARRALINSVPVEDVYHCSDEWPMLFLAVRGTVLRAARGYPEVLHAPHLLVIHERIESYMTQLAKWGIDIPFDVTPSWQLFSDWG